MYGDPVRSRLGRPCAAPRIPAAALLAGAAAVFVVAGSPAAHAIAQFHVSGEAIVTVSGRPLEEGLVELSYTAGRWSGTEPAAEFPSFSSWHVSGPPSGELPATIAAGMDGVAVHTGGAEPATVEGGLWQAIKISLINPTRPGPTSFTWTIDLTVEGSFEFSADVQDGASEIAGTRVMMDLTATTWEATWPEEGGVAEVTYIPLEGAPEDPVLLDIQDWVRPPTAPTPGPAAYSFVTSTRILGVREHYQIRIPPSFIPGQGQTPSEIVVRIFVGGEATSALDAGTALTVADAPPGVPPLPAEEAARSFDDPPLVRCPRPVRERALPNGQTVPIPAALRLFELLASDDGPEPPEIYVSDATGSGPFGPFASGDVVRMTRVPWWGFCLWPQGAQHGPWHPGGVPHLFLRGHAVLTAVDSAGQETTLECALPRPPFRR